MDAIVVPVAGGLLIAAVVTVAVARRHGWTASPPYRRKARTAEDLMTPDVAAALARRTLRRGRLRLNDEPGGTHRGAPGTEGAD